MPPFTTELVEIANLPLPDMQREARLRMARHCATGTTIGFMRAQALGFFLIASTARDIETRDTPKATRKAAHQCVTDALGQFCLLVDAAPAQFFDGAQQRPAAS